MNIFIHEMKSNAKSLTIWCMTMAFLIYAGMIKYSAFSKTGDLVNNLFSQMPPALLQVMGIDPNGDLSSVAVFYSVFFLYFLLLTAVHASMLGALIIAKEERDKTADFLFVKPIKRYKILTPKIAAAGINILILNIFTYFTSIFSVAKYSNGNDINMQIFRVLLVLLILQILFLGFGFLFGAFTKSSKTATSILSGIILGTFMLKVAIDLNKDIDFLTLLSPFSYFKSSTVMFDGKIDLFYGIFAILLAILGTLLSYYFLNKKDLKN